MTQGTPLNPIATKRVVYSVPGMESVVVRRERADGHAGERSIDVDLYCPRTAGSGRLLPAVLFVTGFPDAGAQQRLGCRPKDMAAYVSWAQLVTCLNHPHAPHAFDLFDDSESSHEAIRHIIEFLRGRCRIGA